MRFPDRAFGICMALFHRFPDLARGDDDQRRALTRKIAEQTCFELGNHWGTKRADPTRPPSKDAIAYLDGTTLYSFDWQNGATREPNPPGEMENITGQVFIPVDPINHLSVVQPDPGVILPSPGTPEDPVIPFDTMLTMLAAINDIVTALLESQRMIDARLAAIEQSRYEARGAINFFGERPFSVVLTRKVQE